MTSLDAVRVPSPQEVADSLHRNLGMTVTSVRRQTRWRPCWFVDAERDGEPIAVVVRGDRIETSVQPLRREFAFHGLLERSGIAVPAVYGWLDDIGAVAMERVLGRPDFDGVPEAERDAVVDEYLHQLARLHSLDIAPFVEAGMLRAASPEDSGTLMHFELERLWRTRKRRPNPFLEFALGWLHRNPPRSHGRETPVLWDSGQFHHEHGHLRAVLDLEFGHVGDPVVDLTVWRMRDTLIPFGDFRKLYARYEEISGRPVDIEAAKSHHLAAALSNEMIFGAAIVDPVPGTDLMNHMQWTSETNLHATEALAEYLDIDLPTVEVPAARRRRSDTTHAHLVEQLRLMRGDDPFLSHDIRLTFRTTRHLARVAEIGDALAEADLDDLRPVLGHRPSTWWEGDAELERFVLADAATGRHDEALVRLFHRRNLRTHLQLGPPGSKMVAHYPVQRFDGREPVNTADWGA
jgi:aminoglycoside phosphotransferase (APT) family kinase protein